MDDYERRRVEALETRLRVLAKEGREKGFILKVLGTLLWVCALLAFGPSWTLWSTLSGLQTALGMTLFILSFVTGVVTAIIGGDISRW